MSTSRVHGGRLVLLAVVPLLLAGPGSPQSAPAREPLFGNLGTFHRRVTTTSAEAQRYFDQGLVLTFSFNHDEAIRSFREATRLDPKCALAWWGIALANGPHINNPTMDPDHSRAAWEALSQAQATAAGDGANETERDLITALAARYAEKPPDDRKALDVAYANAMRQVWQKHPQDPDIGTLFAESMMDLRPWDLWTLDGKPQPGTEEIERTLEGVLRLAPNHPGANHYYVHVVEASPHPERGLHAADLLRTLVPGAGHMVHMPAHIYSRAGRWDDAVAANEHAIEVDRVYRQRSPEQGFYHVYMAHNHHFLCWAAMMQGRSRLAISAARDMIAGIPPEFVKAAADLADGYMTIALEAMMRFGKWDDILHEPPPPDYLPITTTQWHFTRGVAFAATGRVDSALVEQAAFEAAAGRIGPDAVVGNNSARQVLDISRHVLQGEIRFRQGKYDGSIAELTRAVSLEDSLRYDEAPDWLQPVRHTLGGVLAVAGRYPESEAVYRADLERHPENGWSLYGLGRALRAQKRDEEAAAVEKRFRRAWSKADIKLQQTCLCLPPMPGM